GNDVNDCGSVGSACRSFQRAHDQTTEGGQIACVDSLNDPLSTTINKSITIDCAGTSATATVFTINAAGVVVVIRNLGVFGLSQKFSAINFLNGATLIVENCVVRDTAIGIVFQPSTADARLIVTDTLIENNG